MEESIYYLKIKSFFELDEYENELELTIISPFSYEIISSASTFV